MQRGTRQNFNLIAFGVILFASLFHFSVLINFLRGTFRLFLPIIAGGILALFLNVPVKGIEKRLLRFFQKRKKQLSKKALHRLSLVMALIAIVLVFGLILTLVVPEIVNSFQGLYAQIKEYGPKWVDYFENQNINTGGLKNFLGSMNLNKALQSITESLDEVLSNVLGTLSSTVSNIVTAAFGFIISIYMILDEERLSRHSKKLIYAYLKPAWAENILRFCRMFSQSFTNFLTGQCLEAIILGILMFIAFTLFKLPYGILVGVLTAFCAIIPYIGAFISSAISVLLILLLDPTLVLRCLIVYSAVQFIENQFIYPRVVGSSVGLPPLYTLIAAMIGGKLFGILGIIFSIPLTAVILELIKEDSDKRLLKQPLE